jgi:hypothetical protein
VSFAAITLCVASRVFVVISLSTQSGNFWIHPRMFTINSRVLFSRVPAEAIFTTTSRTALGPTQPPTEWVPGALSLRVKLQGHEADHSSPLSAEVKNVPLPPRDFAQFQQSHDRLHNNL